MGIGKRVGFAVLALSGLVGIAIACSELPMPPLPPI